MENVSADGGGGGMRTSREGGIGAPTAASLSPLKADLDSKTLENVSAGGGGGHAHLFRPPIESTLSTLILK